MISSICLFAAGLILICLGGDRLVDAAVAIARRLGIPQIVVGATIVSLGTTLPEILVSTTAAFEGSAAICAGNAFGSIICNTSLIAGLTQLISPTKKVSASSVTWRTLLFFVVCLAMLAYGWLFRRFDRIAGFALLASFAFYVVMNIRMPGSDSETKSDGSGSLIRQFLTLFLCALLLYIGAKLLVDNGIILAEAIGVPERVIAVTFIALGTSLPELVTSLTSVIKGFGNVGLGNIIGANLLNLLLVIGIPATVSGIDLADGTLRLDIPLGILVMAVLTVPLMVKKRAYRVQGIILLTIYGIYCVSQFMA